MLNYRANKKTIAALSLISLLTVTSQLSSCGFHLRGQSHQVVETKTQAQTLQQFALQSANKKIKQAIVNAASLQAITISETSDWSLSINNEERDSIRVSATQSVSTDQFRLKLSIDYTLSYQGKALKTQSITGQAIFQNDSDQALSKSYEKETIYNELYQQIANDLLQQLQTLSLNPPSCDCDETEPSATEQ